MRQRLKDVGTFISEYSFANLYLFRKTHDYSVEFIGDDIFIRGATYDGKSFLMPTVDMGKLNKITLRDYIRDVDFLFPIPEEWRKAFGEDRFYFLAKEEEMDYVYTVDKISRYPGSRLHKKRNLLKQFLSLYKYEAFPLTDDRLADARHILESWQEETGGGAERTDYQPCLEALTLYDELVLCGCIYYVDSEPAAFIIGEELNREMFAIHFAKAKVKFKGIYQYMYSTFAKVLPVKYKYLNFEQDLGQASLRIAKSSYLPDIMLKKYRVSLR